MREQGEAEGVRDAFAFILLEILADMLWRVTSYTILDSNRATAVIKTVVWLAREVPHSNSVSRLSVMPVAGTCLRRCGHTWLP